MILNTLFGAQMAPERTLAPANQPVSPIEGGGGSPARAPGIGGFLASLRDRWTTPNAQGLDFGQRLTRFGAELQDISDGGQRAAAIHQRAEAERQQRAAQARQQQTSEAFRAALRPDGSFDQGAYVSFLSQYEAPSISEALAMGRASEPEEPALLEMTNADGSTYYVRKSDVLARLGSQGQPAASDAVPPELLQGAVPLNPSVAAPSGAAAPQGIDWSRLIQRESGGDQSAVSPRGAFGRAQLMPDTADYVARRMGDPSLAQRARTDPAVNERLGRAYLDEQMQAFGNPAVALAAYNAGPGKAREWVTRFGQPQPGREREWAMQIPYRETREYVLNILEPR